VGTGPGADADPDADEGADADGDAESAADADADPGAGKEAVDGAAAHAVQRASVKGAGKRMAEMIAESRQFATYRSGLSSVIPIRVVPMSSRSVAARPSDAADVRSDLLQLIDGVTDYAIVLLDREGRVTTWTPGAQRISGYRADEILGSPSSRLYSDESRESGRPERELVAAAESGRFEGEGWRVRKDGSRYWASFVITALRSPTGELRGYGVVVRDLGERWFGTPLEGVLQSLADGILVHNRSGRLVWANDAAVRMAGCASATELVEGGAWDAGQEFHDEAGQPLRPDELPGRRRLRGEDCGPTLVRVRNRTTGRVWWAWVRTSGIAGFVGGPPIAVSAWHEVTGEKRREEATRYLSRATSVLSESLDYGATMARLAHVLVPELADWCAVAVLENGELHILAVAHVDPTKESLARSMQAKRAPRLDDPLGMGAVMRTGKSQLFPDVTEDLLVTAAYGDAERLAALRTLGLRSGMAVPLKVGDRTLGVMLLVGAESGRRYDDHDLALAEELGRRAGIAIENARAYREARDAIRLRDDFLSIAGHELRTPLTALQLQLQSVDAAFERGQVAADPERWGTRVHKTVSHAHRLQRLIDELLDVSRITSGRLVLEREETDLAELWREVIERYAGESARAGSPVSFETAGPTAGRWDRARIDQVLTNLLSNAVKYGAGKPVRVTLEGRDGVVRTTVRDEGIGIDPAAQARMFGRFERAVSERHYGGFGLGLWIVRELVEAHGGKVGFESEPGRGSTFWIELPTGTDA
jgi:PAS domain S-box-containing protein